MRLVLRYPNDRQEDEGLSAYSVRDEQILECKALYEGFVVKINGRDWTVNIMMSSEKPHLHCWRVMNLRSKMIPLVRDSGGRSC